MKSLLFLILLADLKDIPSVERTPLWCQNTNGHSYGQNGYKKNCSCRKLCHSQKFLEACVRNGDRNCKCEHGCPR